ncbi:MAG TPA: ACT domain-containing protein [Chloroflexota bacterium]|nr:ACT domain-containing protein [Chloroflexota bacterium]
MAQPLRLRTLPGWFSVCRFAAGSPLPAWALDGTFSSITRTKDELSVVCAADVVPGWVQREDGWRCLMLLGPFPFNMVGILLSVLAPLAEAKVGVFALSTYDTDYVLVKDADLARALEALAEAGHTVEA